MNNTIKYLPIGTVLTLADGRKPIMIYGRKQYREGDEKNIWDYIACLYPEGNLGDKYNVFFQHNEIGEILHLGFENEDEARVEEILHRV